MNIAAFVYTQINCMYLSNDVLSISSLCFQACPHLSRLRLPPVLDVAAYATVGHNEISINSINNKAILRLVISATPLVINTK